MDGEVILVRHPEQAMFAEGKTTVVIADAEDHLHILDVDQVSKLRLLPKRGSSPKTGLN